MYENLDVLLLVGSSVKNNCPPKQCITQKILETALTACIQYTCCECRKNSLNTNISLNIRREAEELGGDEHQTCK